jgi:hypothetical protein
MTQTGTDTRCQTCKWTLDNADTDHHLCQTGARFVRVLHQDFAEDDIHDGDITYQDTEWIEINCLPDEWDANEGVTAVNRAADEIRDEGATEYNGWFSNPDGSYVIDYRTGMRRETAVFLVGFTDDEESDIANIVTTR